MGRAGVLRFAREGAAVAVVDFDGDTVQDLLRQTAERRPDRSGEAALRVPRGLLDHDLPRIYEAGDKELRDLGTAMLLHERITAESYVRLEASYLRAIYWPHGGSIDILQGQDMNVPSRPRANIIPIPAASTRVSGEVKAIAVCDALRMTTLGRGRWWPSRPRH